MKEKYKNIIAIFLLAIFSILVILGINSGECTMVFRHAIAVCLECIGLG